ERTPSKGKGRWLADRWRAGTKCEPAVRSSVFLTVLLSSPLEEIIANPRYRWCDCLQQVRRLVVRSPVVGIMSAWMREQRHKRGEGIKSSSVHFMLSMLD